MLAMLAKHAGFLYIVDMENTATRRTKVEWQYSNAARTKATIKELYVDSGRTKRIILRLEAETNQELQWQIAGAVEWNLKLQAVTKQG